MPHLMFRRLLSVVCFVLALAVIALVMMRRGEGGGKASLTVYCAAGLKKPVEAIAAAYREELGIQVNLQYGGTGTLLSQIEVAKRGDLFIAADDGSLADAGKGSSSPRRCRSWCSVPCWR